MAVKICSDPEPFVENIYTFPTGAIYKRLSFFAPFCHLPAIVSVRIDNYSEHNGLCYFSVQVTGTIPVALRLTFFNENENELLLLCHLPAYTILNAIFLEQKNHTHWKWRCWISTLGIFFKWLEKIVFVLNMYCYWFSSTTTYPKQMSLFLFYV